MAATMTMGRIEGQVRRNHLLDVYSDAYRWTPQTVLVFIYDAIEELCATMNAWARFNQETGNLLSPYNVPEAKALSMMDAGASLDASVTAARAIVIPVDDRFEQCLIHLAASKCFSIDDSDTANAAKAADLYEKAKGYAQS
jgi:hypothetical protein